MEPDRFRVVFEKLSCGCDGLEVDEQFVAEVGAISQESEEIAELRRISLEISDPEPVTYSST